MRILTWHVHGSYLFYLVQARDHDFYLPVRPDRPEGYGGRAGDFPWADNVHDIPAEEVQNQQFDLIIFQSRKNYLEDQFEILSPEQRDLPRIYIEHDPPRHGPEDAPTNTKHVVDDPNVLLVHVTHFNNLMWDNNRTPTHVIEHGVTVTPAGGGEEVIYTGDLERGIVVVNGLRKRGRRLGLDVFQYLRQRVPLDLAGIESAELGGLGPVPLQELWALESRYRFFFNPIRYTSMGLAVCEAMMLGMPIIGLATTEMVTAVVNGVNGYVDTNVDVLMDHMHRLLNDPAEAHLLSQGARRIARERFGIDRFVRDWNETYAEVTGHQGLYAVHFPGAAWAPPPLDAVRGQLPLVSTSLGSASSAGR
jgi:glycosyltransferase involved in cell wall biosynthesis